MFNLGPPLELLIVLAALAGWGMTKILVKGFQSAHRFPEAAYSAGKAVFRFKMWIRGIEGSDNLR